MQHATSDGLVTVAVPDEPGWVVEATAVDAEGSHVSVIKCKRTGEGEFFFAMAKDYTVALDNAYEPDELLREVYPVLYAKMFASVTIDALREIVVGDRVWCEADYRLVHARLGEIVKRERVTVVGEHVILVSGEGRSDDMRAHAAMLDAWMDGALFATLA